MRSVIRAVLVVVAVVFAVPAMPAFAQKPAKTAKADNATWTVVDVKTVPVKVITAKDRAFPQAQIKKAERSGTGATMVYRLTMTGKVKTAQFNTKGEMLQ